MLGWLYFSYDPARYPFPRCPFNLLTGLYCAGCGSQRATHALLHGKLVRAASFNLLAVVSLPLLALGAADQLRTSLTGQPHRSALLYRPWLTWTLLVLTIAFTVARNLPGPVGTWLAP